MLRLMIAVLLFIASPALAWETDCPLEHRSYPGSRLAGGYPSYDGGDGGVATSHIQRGDHWHDTEAIEKWKARDGKLTCQYNSPHGRDDDIILPVPGLLIRCDWLGRDVPKPRPVAPDTGGPNETVFLRIWCTSRP
ncbi:hypothetical protein A6A04_11185 [Paramagnetospirillum marisnigri]|uniref:Uncharacterized protein n=1 Tax=Paramagnetospirillum marisnigri TaxID=1285242 RepID=A0A178MX53_9PROT|nr:hypothetical protein [Paramagnetospirillum marisnigri]OAN55219.1 hypothetical protein A6A04_11185 [Paramagnetospirillum marisnigri]